MFDVLIDYYKEYPQLLTVTIIVLAASLVVGFIAVIAYKAVRSEKRKKQLERQAIEELNDFSGQIENDVIKIEGEEQPAAPARPTQTPTSKTEPIKQQAPNFSPADCEPKNETVSPAPEEPATKKTKGAKPTDSGDEIAAAEPPLDMVVPAEPERTAKAPQKSRYTGKWVISDEDGKYTATLLASNGEVLLRSEVYTSLSGIKSGITTINKNIAKGNFALSTDKNGKFFFKLYSSSTRLLCISEVYGSKTLCESAIESVKRFSQTAVIVKKSDLQVDKK